MAIEKRISKDGQVSFRVRIRKEGHNISETFPSRKLAVAREKEVESMIASGRLVSGYISNHTLKEAFDRYCEEIKSCRPATQRGYKYGLRPALEFFGEGRLVRTITVSLIHDYGLYLRNKFNRGTPHQNMLIFKQLLLRLYRWDWIPTDLCRKVPNPGTSPIVERCLKPDELGRLLKELDSSLSREFKNLVLFALYTGMRKLEILELQWTEVDFERRVVLLPVERTKTKCARRVALSEEALAILQHQRALHPDPQTHVFYTIRKTPFRCVMSVFKGACKRAGLGNVRFHDLRHTAASYLAQAGANTFRVAQFLGHRDLSTVARYAHLSEDESFNSVMLIADKVSNC